jgi:hypothetical protein
MLVDWLFVTVDAWRSIRPMVAKKQFWVYIWPVELPADMKSTANILAGKRLVVKFPALSPALHRVKTTAQQCRLGVESTVKQ